MKYEWIVWAIMVVVFVAYVSFIWIKYGVQKSISDSYYRLPEKQKYLFTLFCWGFSIPAIILGNCFLMFLAGTGICFVGAAAAFKGNEMEHWVHMAGAYTGVLLSQIAIWNNFDLWSINVAFVAGALPIMLCGIKNKIWYVEILAFTSIMVALALNI
jgi:hypothetical protein